uniref:Leucine-rich repeat-containing protein 56 n=2 Tax=Clytia hemisphaerica TaxID=252671 RepID=A0A7M5V0M3_9CNID
MAATIMNFDVFNKLQNAPSLYTMQSNEPAIRIYEICDSTESNPKPEKNHDLMLGEFVTQQNLREITGTPDLSQVEELKLKVDTNETSIGNIGSMVPGLKRLNLSNSYVTSIRDLGTSFSNLTMIWLCRCSLVELDGISSLSSMKELFLAFNDISDLSPLSMLDTLEVLDLEANNIDDITQVEFLSLCSDLINLTMKGNPIEVKPTPESQKADLKYYNYSDAIITCLPMLKILDDEPLLVERVDGQEVKRVNPRKVNRDEGAFENDLKLIEVSLKSLETEELVEENEDIDQSVARPRTATRRSRTAKSPEKKITRAIVSPEDRILSSAIKKDTEKESEPMKSTSEVTNFSSDLTSGNVMCGNPFAALRRRKRQTTPEDKPPQKEEPVTLVTKSKSDTSANIFKAEHSYLSAEETNVGKKEDVFEELRQWRLKNQSLFDSMATTKIKSNTSRSTREQTTSPSKAVDTTASGGDGDVSPRRKQPTPLKPLSPLRSSIDSSMFKRRTSPQKPAFSPAPPSLPRKNTTPGRTRRSLQTSPPKAVLPNIGDRPHTVGGTRTEIFLTDVSYPNQLSARDGSDIQQTHVTLNQRTDINANIRSKSHPVQNQRKTPSPPLSPLNRPMTARAALQSLQRPFSRTNDR